MTRDPRLSKKILLQKKIVDRYTWDRGFQKKSFYNKKKGPHPAQCHDSNSAFRR